MPQRRERQETKGMTFNEFAEAQNSRAPFTQMGEGLGIRHKAEEASTPGKSDIELIQEIARNAACEVRESREDTDPIKLATIIAAKIVAILPTMKVAGNPKISSMLDTVTTGLTEPHQVKRFLRIHGINIDVPNDIAYLEKVFKEAVNYFNAVVAKRSSEHLPQKISNAKKIEDILAVFRYASGNLTGTTLNKTAVRQSCALLRIMGVIDYIERDPGLSLIGPAQKRLHEIKDSHFKRHRDESGNSTTEFVSERLGGIPFQLVDVLIREKERERIIGKLLRKPETRAADVMDKVGMMILTSSRQDTLKLIYYLFFDPSTAIFPAMTIRVGETKNLLIDANTIINALAKPEDADRLIHQLKTGQASSLLVENQNGGPTENNPASASAYTD